MKVVDHIREKTMKLVYEYMMNKIKDKKEEELWKKLVKKACATTEDLSEAFAEQVVKSLSVQRHFTWLTNNKSLDDIYHSFILTIAMELCARNYEPRLAVSLGTAILDNWFEAQKVDYLHLKKQVLNENIKDVIKDKELLYREYFLLYNDSFSEDIVRVYYPKNGEGWINWDEKYSIEIQVNLSKGVEFGFCKVGFGYSRIIEENEKFLQIAYISGDKEIFRFERFYVSDVDDKKILWAS